MTDDGTKITIRIRPDDIQRMEDFMAEHDIGNRSDFIRDAISGYIEQKSKKPLEESDGGIFVRLSEVQLGTLENMRDDGAIYDVESYVRNLIVSDIIPKECIEDSKVRAFKAAQQAARMK
jgi:metal-responsive CopG/Arc/MetJ family transcriptional regulator